MLASGTLLWTASSNRIAVGREASETWQEQHYQCEHNDMFMGVAEEFLRILGDGQAPTCTIEDGARILEVMEAARESGDRGQSVALEA